MEKLLFTIVTISTEELVECRAVKGALEKRAEEIFVLRGGDGEFPMSQITPMATSAAVLSKEDQRA